MSATRRGVFRFAVLLAVLAGSLSGVFAQQQEQPKPISTSGFVDVYFSRSLAQPASQANRFRNFDVSENQFDLAMAEFVIQKPASPIGFRIDAAFGSANDMVQGTTESTLKNLQQAYVTAVIPAGSGLTVDAGKFVTHMGYEVIESADNWNYSRSLIFSWAIPYYHFGVRASYTLLPTLTATGYLYNGWNSLADNNRAKTVGASILATPTDQLTFIAGWIGGNERPDSTGHGARHVVDASLLYRPLESLTLALNANYGTESLPSDIVVWKGVAAYVRFLLTENSGITIRSEIFDDRDGYMTGTEHRMGEVTATFEQKFLSHLSLRAEYRHDWSSEPVFEDMDRTDVLKYQNTIAIGAVITF